MKWWFECQALMYGRVPYPGGDSRAEEAPIAFSAPAEKVTPIDGQDYRSVATHDTTIRRTWRLQVIQPEPASGPKVLLHRAHCHTARHGSPITDQEARQAADSDVGPCQVCRPERALHTSTTSGSKTATRPPGRVNHGAQRGQVVLQPVTARQDGPERGRAV